MNGDSYWLTRISPVREALAYRDWSSLSGDDGLDPYGQHKRVWQFFDLPRKPQDQAAPFLFRAEVKEGLPVFYVLSKALPRQDVDKWRVDGYATHCLKGRRDESGRCRGIHLSTLDFEGLLTVTEVAAFTKALLLGIGPAKGFGCGMLLVRRA